MTGSRLTSTVVYDTGALLAAEQGSSDMVAMHDKLVAADIRPLVPVAVLAQAWRGGPQAQLSRVLKGCDVTADSERLGRAAGSLCAASGTADVVDAIVVANAAPGRLPVVTSDPDDIERLADALRITLRLFVV